jgi:hypothetical protein
MIFYHEDEVSRVQLFKLKQIAFLDVVLWFDVVED